MPTRIHLIPETPAHGPVYASAEIRLLRPYQHASLSWAWNVSSGRNVPAERIDVVVTQRAGPIGASPGEIHELVRATRRIGAKLVVDLDDNLLVEHASPIVERGLRTLRWRVRWLLREADAVIVSTPALARVVSHLARKVYVFRNALDETMIVDRKDRGAVGGDIGYFGTASHLEDLMSVAEDLEEGFSRIPFRPLVELCGIADDDRLSALLQRKADVSIIPINPIYGDFMKEGQLRAPWTVAIAPLSSTPFNECKSDIKYLDYAMFGAAGVFSRSTAYAAVRDGETGIVVEPGEWGGAVLDLLNDRGKAKRIAAAAHDDLMSNRTLYQAAPRLKDLVTMIMDDDAPAAPIVG